MRSSEALEDWPSPPFDNFASKGQPLGKNIAKASSLPEIPHGNTARALFRNTAKLMCAAVILFALGVLVGTYRRVIKRSGAVVAGNAGPAEAFWGAVLGNDSSPIIAYSDSCFLLDESNDLCGFGPEPKMTGVFE